MSCIDYLMAAADYVDFCGLMLDFNPNYGMYEEEEEELGDLSVQGTGITPQVVGEDAEG